MPFFILWLFNIPTPFSRMFSCDFPEGEFGQVLEGDPAVPPTVVETWPAWANAIRNAFLATFVWKTYSVIDLGHSHSGEVYLVFGDGAVMPRRIPTRFIIVKHGREACRFIVANALGFEVKYSVVGRGDQCAAIDAVYHQLRGELRSRGLRGDNLGRELNKVSTSDLVSFV